MVTICTRLRQAREVRRIAEAHDGVFWAAGTHPMHAAEEPMATVEALEALARAPKFVAIGETGLDYHYTADSAAVQQESFRLHIGPRARTGLPLVVHARDADDDIGRDPRRGACRRGLRLRHALLHRGPASPRPRWGSASTSRSRGSRPSAAPRRCARSSPPPPRDRMLVETDSPYLAPQPHRGKRNEPAYVADTARLMAGHLGMEPEELAASPRANFDRLFRGPPR